jgi:hypothetical protein
MDERIEGLVGILFGLTAAASIGIGEISLFGVDLLESLVTLGPLTIDYATVGSLVALIVGYLEFENGQTDVSMMEPVEKYLALGAVALVIYGSYKPAFWDGQALVVQLAGMAVSIAGYWALAYN